MSYILDALKKSDRERQEEAPTQLQHLYEAQPASRDAGISRRYRWPWFLLFGLLVSGGLVQWMGGNNRIDGNRQESEEIKQATPAPMAMAPPQEPADKAFPESKVAVAERDTPPSPIKVQTEWFDDWFQHLPKKDYSSPAEVEGENLAPVASIPAHPSEKIPIPKKIKKGSGKDSNGSAGGNSRHPPASIDPIRHQPTSAGSARRPAASADPAGHRPISTSPREEGRDGDEKKGPTGQPQHGAHRCLDGNVLVEFRQESLSSTKFCYDPSRIIAR